MSLFDHDDPEDRDHLHREQLAILALAVELKTLCDRIGQATGLSETEVGELARELLTGQITTDDAVCVATRPGWFRLETGIVQGVGPDR